MADYFFLFQYYMFLLLIIIIGLGGVEGYTDDDDDGCRVVSNCSDYGPSIRFPFRLRTNQPRHCGYGPGFDLSCDHMNQTVIQLPIDVKAVVVDIDYRYQSIQLQGPNNCFPALLPRLNFSASPFYDNQTYTDYALFNCSPAERDMATLVPCLSGLGYQVFAAPYRYGRLSDELTSCVKTSNFSSIPYSIFGYSRGDLLRLTWSQPDCGICEEKGKWCRWKIISNNNATSQLECVEFPKTGESHKFKITAAAKKGLSSVLGVVLLSSAVISLYLVYNSLKRKQEDQVKVKTFLEDYKALKPSRYSFSDIKKITNNFKEKLGVGAYGTVFKGKLSDEIFVAVKVLESSMENGAEFIKEVGTMATIHHVSVVRLVGFCADGIKRALIYEFCPNESLEKFIYSETQNNIFLGWEKLQDIALGIAKGIEYLHHGCDNQILHFDIKPHNILLDHNFNPKIADFGLAKLCPKDQSKVSMTKARGTMGYIAPEVFSRSFGNVSSKSDVYSFGMLLLEMVSGRKNNDPTVQNTSHTYFPELIYDRLCRGEELGMRIEVEEHAPIVKKLTVVGLCCIQWSPVDRPPMKTVIQMLEGKGDTLRIPPNPFASIARNVNGTNNHARAFSTDLEVISEEV